MPGGGRYGRQFVNDAFARAEKAAAVEAANRKNGFVKAPKAIRTVHFTGSVDAIDWMDCRCGYRRATSNGKVLPQSKDPAWASWSEGKSSRSKQSLHAAVRKLCLDQYKINYIHHVISIGTDPGVPDLTLWGPGRPGVMVYREEKSMTGRWEPGQREHLLSLHQNGFDASVWKPCCLLSGRIDRELATLAGVQPRRWQPTVAPSGLSWKDIADGALTEK